MQIGDYRVEIIPDTEFRLDGGAMFGVVPRNLWSQVCPPDDQNRIRMNMNCVFIDTGAEKVLIETGIGDKWTTKQVSMYGIERQRPLAETLKLRTGLYCCRNHDRRQHTLAFRSCRWKYNTRWFRQQCLHFRTHVTLFRALSWSMRNSRLNGIARAICLTTGCL